MTSRLSQLLVWPAGIALLVAMAVDTLAMVGRALGVPLVGSMEIIQAVVLLAASGALIIATLGEAHARVNLLLERVSEVWRTRLQRVHAIAAAFFYMALLAGSVWIAADLWQAHEESEILQIPYRPLRVVVVLALLTLLIIAFRRIFFGRSR